MTHPLRQAALDGLTMVAASIFMAVVSWFGLLSVLREDSILPRPVSLACFFLGVFLTAAVISFYGRQMLRRKREGRIHAENEVRQDLDTTPIYGLIAWLDVQRDIVKCASYTDNSRDTALREGYKTLAQLYDRLRRIEYELDSWAQNGYR